MKILTVIGARPQFIKAASVSRFMTNNKCHKIEEVIVHTGQHYDHNMSQRFFDELGIPAPKYNLKVGSNSHGNQTGMIMSGLENIVELETPDWILVYGDTNSTLAAALVAAKTPCRLAHVESGLRSYRWGMPEEVNRIVTDRLSDLLFCPTTLAKKNLEIEGRTKGIFITGDIMYDSFLHYRNVVNYNEVMSEYSLSSGQYLLATIHRAENTDNKKNLSNILHALRSTSKNIKVILPIHPRTKKMTKVFSLSLDGITTIEPVSYLTMVALLVNSKAVITDSGGLQKEAYFSKTPCLTIRDETEWVETLNEGWNQLVSPCDESNVTNNINNILKLDCLNLPYKQYYGSGNSAKIIIDSITKFL